MECKYSKKQLEELYHCEIYKNAGFYIAKGHDLTPEGNDALFDSAVGGTIERLHEDIRKKIYENLIDIRN